MQRIINPAFKLISGGGRGQGRGGKEYRSRGGRGADGAPVADGEHRPKREYERRSATGRLVMTLYTIQC